MKTTTNSSKMSADQVVAAVVALGYRAEVNTFRGRTFIEFADRPVAGSCSIKNWGHVSSVDGGPWEAQASVPVPILRAMGLPFVSVLAA